LSTLTNWAIDIAQEVAPSESSLAGLWAEAYAAGGEKRKQLLAKSNSMSGGFGAGDVASTMPSIFASVHGVAAQLMSLLIENMDTISKIAATLSAAIAVAVNVDKISKVKKKQQKEEVITLASQHPALEQVLKSMREHLRKDGMDEDRCDVICWRVVSSIMTNPEKGKEIVQKISEAKQ
jgi:hypothetical protein